MSQQAKPVQRIVVDIFGQSYPLRTDEPEHIKELAAHVDRVMKKTAGSINSFDPMKIAVLSALALAEECAKLKKDYDELVELIDEK